MSIVKNKIFSTNTAEYTVIDLKQEMDECINIILNLGYEVHIPVGIDINNRLSKSLGRCIRRRGVYRIEANLTFLRVASSQNVHNMIMHECIHCVEGCFNHGAKWKSVAAQVMEKYPQYTIRRCSNDEEYSKIYSNDSKYRYEVICRDCGKTIGRYKNESKTVKSITRHEKLYRCGYCNSNNLSVNNI